MKEGIRVYRVLIVEDEVIVRAWLKKQVNWDACGFEVVSEAGNGRDALAIYQRESIDLILTDIRIPIMDGIELLRAIRATDKRIRFIILTCLDEFALVKQALELDVTNYILKLTSEPDEIERELLRAKAQLDQADGADRRMKSGESERGGDAVHAVKNQRLTAALNYLENHYFEDISLSTVADFVGVTPNYLGKIFLLYRGCTFTDELNRMRISKAKSLLDDPSYRIYEVAEKAGFSNTTYFFRVFKKYENCTPTEYRAQGSDSYV